MGLGACGALEKVLPHTWTNSMRSCMQQHTFWFITVVRIKLSYKWQFSNWNQWHHSSASSSGLMHWSNFFYHHITCESRASEWGGSLGCNGRWCWLRVDILCPSFSMGFLAPRNLLQNLVLYVHIVVLDSEDGRDLFLPNATKSNFLTVFEQKISSSLKSSDYPWR